MGHATCGFFFFSDDATVMDRTLKGEEAVRCAPGCKDAHLQTNVCGMKRLSKRIFDEWDMVGSNI